jgi:hypothetical protein
MLQDDCIVLFNKDNPRPLIFLFKTKKGWYEDDMKKSIEIVEKLKEKFKHVIEDNIRNRNIDLEDSYSIGDLNDFIGFMIYDDRYNVIFKHKPLTLSSNGRVQKGKSCDKGFTKNNLFRIINDLHKKGSRKNKKYIIDNSRKRATIKKIYNTTLNEEINREKILKNIGTKQLCIEIELLFRYYNFKKLNGKIWFLSEIESNINKIENIGI